MSAPRVTCLVLAFAAASAPLAASARVQSQAAPLPEPSLTARIVTRLADAFAIDLGPDTVVARLVRWQIDVRDIARAAVTRLALIAQGAAGVPDVSVLRAAPVEPSKSTWNTSAFGWRDDPIRHRKKWHSGADIRAKSGTPVMCAGDGIVIFAGRRGGYGNVIDVDHGGGVVTRYAHLRRIEIKADQAITAGQRIGQVGSTGRTTGPHLHFEVRLDGRAVDPGMAMTVAEIARESPDAAKIAAFALAPEVQALQESELDPPRTAKKKSEATEQRPERRGREKRVRPVS